MPPPQLYRQSIRRAALFLIGSSAVFSGVGALVKSLSSSVPIEMLVFFRNAAGLAILLPLLFVQRHVSLRTDCFWNHAVRAASGVMAMYCFFYAIAHLHLSEAISLNFTSPLLVPILAYLVIREKMPGFTGVYLLVGFVGVLLIVKPGVGVFQPAALVGIISAGFAAFALVNIRKLTRTEPAIRVVFYFSLIASALTVIPMLRVWQTPTMLQGILLVLIGVFATLGQWLLTRGYASGPAGQVGIFHYSAVIFGAVVDWVVWRSTPDRFSLAGVLIICVAGILMSRATPSTTKPMDAAPSIP